MACVYILELEDNFYYVGKTTNFANRLLEHLSGKGSEWTKLHLPTTKFTQIEATDEFEEDRQTLRLMKEHGIDYVRGGSFSKPILDESTRKVIAGMLRSSEDACFHCGEKGHFARFCSRPASKQEVLVASSVAGTNCACCGRFWKTLPVAEPWYKRQCNFCEHIGYCMYEEDMGCCARCGRESHNHKRCYAKRTTTGEPCQDLFNIKKEEKKTGQCAKCGRESHTHKQCYAKTDRYGYRLKF